MNSTWGNFNDDSQFQEDIQKISKYLNEQRNLAYYGDIDPPRVIIVGPCNSGKSTLCTKLIDNDNNLGYYPAFIDLDIGQGQFPGVIYTTSQRISNSYFYGHVDPGKNDSLYRHLVSVMSNELNYNYCGFIANTFGWIAGLGRELLLDCFQLLKINVIIVLDDITFYNDLSNQFGNVPTQDTSTFTLTGGIRNILQ